MDTTNLEPNTVAPKTGTYYCTMCKEGDAAIRNQIAAYAREKGLSSSQVEEVFRSAGMGSNEPITQRHYKEGERLGECSRHGDATGWTLSDKSEQGEGCFIATACYGSYNCDEVIILRNFRDSVLMHRKLGRFLVNNYYAISPPIARWLNKKPLATTLIRKCLISPIIHLVK